MGSFGLMRAFGQDIMKGWIGGRRAGHTARRGDQPAVWPTSTFIAGRQLMRRLSYGAICGRLRGAVRSAEEAEAALVEVKAWVEHNGLTLHPDKTQMGDCRKKGNGSSSSATGSKAATASGARRAWPRKDPAEDEAHARAEPGRVIAISTGRYAAGSTTSSRRIPTPPIGRPFIRRRLRAILRKQDKRPGVGKRPDDHRQWPNAFFAAGLFALHTAWN